MSKAESFEKVLSRINSENIRAYTRKALENLPDYFFTVAASSSGKYHPEYVTGEGGLVRHVMAAALIGSDLLSLQHRRFTRREKDIILAALILHDGVKHGWADCGRTTFNHPAALVDLLTLVDHRAYMTDAEFRLLCGCVASHMGQWNESKWTGAKLPKPRTAMQKFVHDCDYLASRRYITVDIPAAEETAR